MSKIPIEISFHLRYLYQDLGIKGKELCHKYKQFSKASIYRHAKKPIGSSVVDKRKQNPGRPPKLSERDKRSILRQVEVLRDSVGHFTSRHVRVSAGVECRVSDETVRRVLRSSGLRYRHARKKGLLTQKDLKVRLAFARKVRRKLNPNIWTHGICFYLDGVSFTHKYNPSDQARAPKTTAWRRRNEGLKYKCTTKGSHEGTGGKVAHFIAAIAHGKGMVLCEQYHGKLNGQNFANFVRGHFPGLFHNSSNPKGKLFLQDGDPSQNSKKAKEAMHGMGARKFNIPPRSPDMNPIENIFHPVKRKLNSDAIENNITHEGFKEFSDRVKKNHDKFSH